MSSFPPPEVSRARGERSHPASWRRSHQTPCPCPFQQQCPIRCLESAPSDDYNLTTSHQCAHKRHAMPLAQSLPSSLAVSVLSFSSIAHLDILPRRACLTGQSRFVNFERNSGDETNVGRDSIANGKCDKITREERVGERSKGLSVSAISLAENAASPDKMTKVRHELPSAASPSTRLPC